jgi:four helix bundle protein
MVGLRAQEKNPMPELIQRFEDLECWQAGRELRLFIARRVLTVLPAEERHRLGDQVLRAARSITANIAEGYGRFHYLDNAKFCSNARGSCCEVLDHLITAVDEGLLPSELLVEGRSKSETTLRILNGYIAYLKRAPSRPEDPKITGPK